MDQRLSVGLVGAAVAVALLLLRELVRRRRAARKESGPATGTGPH